MIQSMTGYGKATVELPDKKINVEIKSLNSKAMDLSARIAPLYREKEMEIRNEISRKLERGKVDFSLWIEKERECGKRHSHQPDIGRGILQADLCHIRKSRNTCAGCDGLVCHVTPHAGCDDEE